MNKKNKTFIVILLRSVSVLTLIYCSLLYCELNLISKEGKPIEYLIKSTQKQGSAKTKHGLIQIEYNKKRYDVEVQLEEYYRYINKNKKPLLYYSQKRDIIFAQRRINQFQAWAIISGIVLFISFIPFDRISKKMDEDIKKKELRRINSDRK